jgi:alkylation response protein AidB-like acyl-CoA dehydrogenase
MNFAFSDEQEFLRETAREFLQRESPMTRVRELMETDAGFDRELWKKMAELGWIGLLIPEEYGGAGLDFVDLVVVLEEMGRSLLPSPFFGNLQGTLAVLKAGSDTQRKDILTQVASGERILTLAITEQAGSEAADDLAARAVRDGSVYKISGTKMFVPDAQNADTFVVVARTGGPGEHGLSLLLVDGNAAGVSITPLASMDQTRRIAEVRFDETPAELLGAENAGFATWAWVRDRALVALAADAIGGAESVLDASVAYAKERIQFGKPIGVHQAIKHRCADMLIEVESSKSITHYAAWAVAEEIADAELSCAMAKAYTSDAYRHCSAENIQIHGGVGFTWEYDCHLFFKRAKAVEVTYGDATLHRERVASLMQL